MLNILYYFCITNESPDLVHHHHQIYEVPDLEWLCLTGPGIQLRGKLNILNRQIELESTSHPLIQHVF